MQQPKKLKFRAGEKAFFTNELGSFMGIVIGYVYKRSIKSLFLKKEVYYELALQRAGDAFISLKAVIHEDRLTGTVFAQQNEGEAEIIPFKKRGSNV